MDTTPSTSFEIQPEDGFVIDANQVEALREIINSELRLEVAAQEAKKLGNDALLFFKALAGNRNIVIDSLNSGEVQHGQ